MANFSVRIGTGPGEEFEQVTYLRPAERADAFEKTEVDGETWYHVQKDDSIGWILSNDLLAYDKVKATTKKRNAGSPFGQTVYAPYAVYMKNQIVSYKNIGWERSGHAKFIVDEGEYAATWGGVDHFSGEGDKNTHFIGNTEQFKGLGEVDEIIIRDEAAAAYPYIRTNIYKVDEQGVGLEDGVDYWQRIVEAGDEERVVFQITDDFETSLIVEFGLKP